MGVLEIDGTYVIDVCPLAIFHFWARVAFVQPHIFSPGTPRGRAEACIVPHRESLERSEDKNCTKWGSYMQDKGDQLAEAAAEGLAFCWGE